jgi:hypothetical protein
MMAHMDRSWCALPGIRPELTIARSESGVSAMKLELNGSIAHAPSGSGSQ